MELSQRQELTQHQTLRMTTELRQGLAVVRLCAADLVEYVNACLEENPVLVDVSERERAQEQGRVRSDETLADDHGAGSSPTSADASRTFYSGVPDHVTRCSADALLEGRGCGSPDRFDWERRDLSQRPFSIDRYLASAETASDCLMTQLRMATDDERAWAIGNFIIGSLDSSGYLRLSAEDAAGILGVGSDEVERVLAIVQRLDPVGIGARSLAECLRLQLGAKGRLTPLLDRLLDGHLADLERKSVASVAGDMGVSPGELEGALREVRSCNPRPGTRFMAPAAPIWPEIVVTRSGDGYRVAVQTPFLAELGIDESYRVIAAETGDEETARYLRSRIREAEGLIRGVRYRKETLRELACRIVELQSEFLDEGIGRLRPLGMSRVAASMGVSVSTVSRLASGNYMQTPRGTYELRFFFHAAAAGDRSVEVSAISVRQRMLEIIESEDPHRPLSDQSLSRRLREEGVAISRRTVAKYRDQLGIPVSAARKRP